MIIELSTGSYIDSITRKQENGWYFFIESDARVYFIGLTTLLELANFAREKGLVI